MPNPQFLGNSNTVETLKPSSIKKLGFNCFTAVIICNNRSEISGLVVFSIETDSSLNENFALNQTF